MVAVFNGLWKLSLGVGALGTAATFSMYNVDGGQRALIYDRFRGGITDVVKGMATFFTIPVPFLSLLFFSSFIFCYYYYKIRRSGTYDTDAVCRCLTGEGTHLYIPWVQKPTVIDVRTRWTKIQADTGSKDLQTVHIVLRVLYRPDMRHLPTIYRELGLDWEDKILPSVGNEILTSTVVSQCACMRVCMCMCNAVVASANTHIHEYRRSTTRWS